MVVPLNMTPSRSKGPYVFEINLRYLPMDCLNTLPSYIAVTPELIEAILSSVIEGNNIHNRQAETPLPEGWFKSLSHIDQEIWRTLIPEQWRMDEWYQIEITPDRERLNVIALYVTDVHQEALTAYHLDMTQLSGVLVKELGHLTNMFHLDISLLLDLWFQYAVSLYYGHKPPPIDQRLINYFDSTRLYQTLHKTLTTRLLPHSLRFRFHHWDHFSSTLVLLYRSEK